MPININAAPDISLDDLCAQMEQGVSVMRSAHVGNARGYNLAVAQLGIPMLLVDHNIVSQRPSQTGDKNYLPGSVVTREAIRPLELSMLGGLALQTETTDPVGNTRQYVDELHTASLQAAFPETEIFTNTDYLRSYESVVAEIIATALDLRPDLFTRTVESDGIIRKNEAAAKLAPSYGILQLNDYPRTEAGVLLPNELDILANFTIEALKSSQDRQVHLSGPDMQHYIRNTNMRNALDELYDALRTRTSLESKLPDILEVDLVPTNNACFVTTVQRAPLIEKIFGLLRAQQAHTSEKQAFFVTPAAANLSSRDTFLADAKQQEKVLDQELQAAIEAASELFVDPKQAPYLSQYDLPLEGGLAMPTENTAYSMSDLAKIFKKLQRFRGEL